MEEYRRLCRWEDNIKMDIKEIGVDVMSYLRREIIVEIGRASCTRAFNIPI